MSTLSEQIIQLHIEGKSYRQIQSILGCSKGTISYHLGAGQKDKTMQRQRDRRSEIKKFLQEVKQASVCADCKEDYPYWIMEFDHLRDKEFNVCDWFNTTRSLDRVKAEVEKCDIVCANCHKNRTHFRVYTSAASSLDVSKFYK